MPTADTSRHLQVLDTNSGGCGCGGCGCGADTDTADSARTTAEGTGTTVSKEAHMATATYSVTGMTCGHCASAVTTELTALDGVTDVQIGLVAGGSSTVTVTSEQPLQTARVSAALEEAGDYRLT